MNPSVELIEYARKHNIKEILWDGVGAEKFVEYAESYKTRKEEAKGLLKEWRQAFPEIRKVYEGKNNA